MGTVLIHGTRTNRAKADRIAAAVASVAYLKFSRKVLVLPMSTQFDMISVLTGAKLKTNAIKSRKYSFDDSGIDALCRRAEQGALAPENFTDCCTSLARTVNSYDIAAISKRADFGPYVARNARLFERIVKDAERVYDLVILVGDSTEMEAIEKLQAIAQTEVTIITQGNKQDVFATPDTLYCINDYDGSSVFTYKKMKEIYGIQSDRKLYPVPYNIRFKDSCRTECSADFFSTNVKPDQSDDNSVFIECVARLTCAIVGMEEPIIQERKFVTKETNRKRGIRHVI